MKFAWLFLSIVFVACGASFLYFTYVVASDTVFPAVADGTLSVGSDSMVLNVLWEGNEIYLLLSIYLAAAVAFLTAGIGMARRAVRRPTM